MSSTDKTIKNIRFDSNGLVPVVAVDHLTGKVLMVAYANEEALNKTLETGFAHYWSRSRKKLWKKGEASGHVQKIVGIKLDCDGDTLLYEVEQTGPACHTGNSTCFFTDIYRRENEPPGTPFLEVLEELLRQRKQTKPEGSYTARLFQKGREAISAKVVEESEEFTEALSQGNRDGIIWEAADVLFFILMALVWADIPFNEVLKHLKSRYGRRKESSKKEN